MIVYSKKIILFKEIYAGEKIMPPFILGPCVIESEEQALRIAEKLYDFSCELKFNLIFKASFDKANRTSITSFRGVGIKKGLQILDKIKNKFNIPVLTDIHEPSQAYEVAQIVDIIQIPAFLVRQTDLVEAAAKTGKVINLKKGQFLSPWEMEHVCKKVEECNNNNYFITERGTFFGYNRLVNDFKYVPLLKKFAPVCFDGTHSLQLPGATNQSSGEPQFCDNLAFTAAAAFFDIFFFETHYSRQEAKSDSSNLILLDDLFNLLKKLIPLCKFLREKIF
ncbi:MAG: 3-deoxy-8-phosphooctulonate synthase [Exilispira sp.]